MSPTIVATLPPDVVVAAQECGWARDLEATVAELLVELGESFQVTTSGIQSIRDKH